MADDSLDAVAGEDARLDPDLVGSPWCARPPTPAYSPSEFSRTKSMSTSPAAGRPAGRGRPSSRRAGRTFAHRSSAGGSGGAGPRARRGRARRSPTAPIRHASWARSTSSIASARHHRARPVPVVGAPVELASTRGRGRARRRPCGPRPSPRPRRRRPGAARCGVSPRAHRRRRRASKESRAARPDAPAPS